MTRGDIITELRYLIGPAIETDNIGLAMWINEAYLYMCDCLTAANPDYFTKVATTTTLAGQNIYDLPADFEKALMMNLKQNGQWFRVEPLPNIDNIPVEMRSDSDQGFSPSSPVYGIYSNKLVLEPMINDSTGLMKLWYVFSVPELSTDADIPAIPTTYHHLLKYGAYANYLDQDDNHQAANQIRATFQQRIDKMIETMFESQAESPKSIQITQGADIYIGDDDYFR